MVPLHLLKLMLNILFRKKKEEKTRNHISVLLHIQHCHGKVFLKVKPKQKRGNGSREEKEEVGRGGKEGEAGRQGK